MTNIPICSFCRSQDVVFDAYAEWDHENQIFTVQNIMDKGHQCNQCEGECRIEWVPDPSDTQQSFPLVSFEGKKTVDLPTHHFIKVANAYMKAIYAIDLYDAGFDDEEILGRSEGEDPTNFVNRIAQKYDLKRRR